MPNQKKDEKLENDSHLLTSDQSDFSGTCSYFVTLLGYSMGVSDYWRFPYLVYRNGGGAFLFPFALMMLVLGIPLYFLEISISQFSGKGPQNIWEISPFFKGTGLSLALLCFVTTANNNVFRAWAFDFLISGFSPQLPWVSCDNEWNRPGCIAFGNTSETQERNQTIIPMTSAEQFWQFKVLKMSSGFGDLGGIMWHFVLYVFIVRLVVALCMIKSMKSIEKVMFVTLFLPMILMIALFIRSLMLDGSVMGILYYITPSFDKLAEPRVWLEAAIMAFYTLGPGWGGLFMIGAHNKFSSDCLRFSVWGTVFDCLSAIINGLICFSILGVMAHSSGLDIEKTITSGLALGFTVYPTAFNFFPLAPLWSGIFFVNILIVGLDGMILMTETIIQILEEMLPGNRWFVNKRRIVLVAAMNFGLFLLSLPYCTKGGIYIFQLIDWYAAACSTLFICFVECIVFTWIYGADRVSRDLILMLGRPLPHVLRFCGAICTPIALLFLIVLSFIRYKPPRYGEYRYPAYTEVLGWCLGVGIVVPILLVFVVTWVRTPGTIKQKLASLTRPSTKWMPKDVKYRETYRDSCHDNRGFLSVLLYNVTGIHRPTISREKPRLSHEGAPMLEDGNNIQLSDMNHS